MNPFPTLPTLVARRVRQSLCACALAASLSAAATLSPLEAAGPSRADARQAAAGPDSAQSRHRGEPALDLPNLLRDGQGKEPASGDTDKASPGAAGIPATALAAYRKAEGVLRGSQPSCGLPWELVAGIGRVESVHASGYGLRVDGSTVRPIRGPRLDGVEFALIRDTDGGRWDGDAVFDRAVGPMQFIPSTWGSWGADGNGDGVRDPNNMFDAALGTARYLCAGERDLRRSADLDRAILSYNNSRAYVNAVRKWMDTYRGVGVVETPDGAPAVPHRPDPADRSSGVRPGPGPLPGQGQVRPMPQRPSGKPAPEPVEKPKPVEKPQPVVDHRTVTRLEPLGSRELDAEVGHAVARRPQVRALDAHGHPVPGARVTFRGNGVRLAGEANTVTVTADRGGIATTPALQPADHPGRFTLTATAPGGRGPAVDFMVTVRPAPTVWSCGTRTMRATRTRSVRPCRCP
ncbi:lytic transglycosylase [Streptomyces chrestomyceticus JCM 4735]|uniref:Lytic transglycosylase n=1 Tax=Streptomyces chrestomyceticus JCM 4735 TaxID=1306181 RepID=A0A7U9KQ60_9ACTN|nr:lytic transglycosylase [Streptomyces chrestomyceticus JCM 4735]